MPGLKYLFRAEYADGTVYEQGSDDASAFEDGRNAFYDIRYKPFKPEDELIRFSLIGAHSYTVDLRDGHFEIDGATFEMTDEQDDIHGGGGRLIYWHRKYESITSFGNGSPPEETSERAYVIGWNNGRRSCVIKVS